MGADITFKKENELFYFRDAYNLIGESYWRTGRTGKVDKKGNNNYITFFNKLANITDEQIQNRIKVLFTKNKKEIAKGETEHGWVTSSPP